MCDFSFCPGFSCSLWETLEQGIGPAWLFKWKGCQIKNVELESDPYQSGEHLYVPNFTCLFFSLLLLLAPSTAYYLVF